MPIGSIPVIASIATVDRAFPQDAAAKAKSDPPPKVPFDPAPALRPTIQDKIEFTRALMLLRGVPL